MFAGDNLKKFGFGGVIGSDKGDFIAVVDRQGKVIKQLLSVNGLGELFGFQNFFSAFAVGFKVNVGKLTRGGLQILDGQLFNQFFTAGRLFGFGGV